MKSLQVNEEVKTLNEKHKVYCQESYAQELYDLMFGSDFSNQKPLEDGQVVKAQIIKKSLNEIILESNHETIFIDLEKEKKFKALLDSTIVGNFIEVQIVKEAKSDYIKGSIEKAHGAKVRDSLFDSLNKNSCAFNCVILERSKGGFFVDIDGIKCFMPGSLAAANKLVDFDSYLGKQVPVMVEKWIKDTDTFIVSNKKYLLHALPDLIDQNIKPGMKFTGFVTGTIKFGAFVEWNEVFTGLLHQEEMEKESKREFKNWTPGREIEFYIKSVEDIKKKDGSMEKRITLTEKEPKK